MESPDEVSIRRAELRDAPAVWPLARDFATSFVPEQRAFTRTFAELADSPNSLLLVAEMADAVVGYLLASWHPTFLANGPVVWVEEVMVTDAVRRHGVGRRLMLEAEDWGRELGAAYVSLASRRAGAFYLALGYEDSAVFFKKAVTS